MLLQDEPPGSFLVRASGRFVGDYTLSVVAPNSCDYTQRDNRESSIQHYHIYFVDGVDESETSKFFSLDKKEIFPSLRKLVEVNLIVTVMFDINCFFLNMMCLVIYLSNFLEFLSQRCSKVGFTIFMYCRFVNRLV